jgi:hypothetical protein
MLLRTLRRGLPAASRAATPWAAAARAPTYSRDFSSTGVTFGADEDSDTAQIKEAVQSLCADFDGKYWRDLDEYVLALPGNFPRMPVTLRRSLFTAESTDTPAGVWCAIVLLCARRSM